VSADDTLKDIRHPDARHKRRNRNGQAAGISKIQIPAPFAWRTIEMMESFAYRALSQSAHRVMSRLEIELQRHGGKSRENGHLPCTYDDFVEYGITRKMIAPAIRELVALGFIEVIRKGSAGNAEHRQAALFLITYRHAGSDCVISDGWKRIASLIEAEEIAASARARKSNERAREFGRKGGLATAAKTNLQFPKVYQAQFPKGY
jgi:hypothetical protein